MPDIKNEAQKAFDAVRSAIQDEMTRRYPATTFRVKVATFPTLADFEWFKQALNWTFDEFGAVLVAFEVLCNAAGITVERVPVSADDCQFFFEQHSTLQGVQQRLAYLEQCLWWTFEPQTPRTGAGLSPFALCPLPHTQGLPTTVPVETN